MAERLQKVLAQAGVGSRRACEQMILQGRVAVNGRVVDRLPVLIEPDRDEVRMDGRPIALQRNVYYLLNKPPGVVCTNHDPAGRPRAIDLLSERKLRLFCVGRLDADSEGLLLLTNDGQLAQRLMHPRYGVPKTYRLTVRGRPSTDAIETLRKGLWLAEGRTQPATIKPIYRSAERTILQITLREGRNREVRRMLAKVGHPVRRLKRVALGHLTIKGLPVGRYRRLTDAEVRYLRSLGPGAR
jgi:23S rRNA pseudouridine2605 synthase